MTTKVLCINSSFGSDSISRSLINESVERLTSNNKDIEVTFRDLANQPPDHLTAEVFALINGFQKPTDKRQQHLITETESMLQEFLAAEIVLVGVPMYNLTVPSTLKAWLDRIMRAGITFRYTETGPQGLAGDKLVVVVASRGGVYSTGPASDLEFQESYLKAAFQFMGVDQVNIVLAEGTSMGPEGKSRARQLGGQSLDSVVTELIAAEA
ncbi:FMN-dependent NADH-azoreductase [Natronospirillum operosum]|uniref:FMN dependent NADH:quinone oxidoreductase n=1 Tax=Natronospirillum operosum TaxID=2759953 RepID=A0A4Z0W8N6_9GAMM|nr:NAD(P)H-dependent oxidoreductase [Natronospirillum operosum]TGG92378.1 FMN-dependent NADH-azoreductase [Natronospirillum operosum]